jgi:YidC/Oxa1 family membrane protein insertase
MDNVRVFLWLTLLAMGYLAYTAWVQDYPDAPAAPVTAVPTPATNGPPSLPDIGDGKTSAPAPNEQPVTAEHGELIRIRTDVLDVLIDSHGGDLVRADLREYPVDKKTPDTVVRLLNDSPPELWVFQTGLRSATGGAEPNHLGTFRTASNDYQMAEGQNELVVSLDWVGEGPVSARKVYTFRRGQYEVDLTLSVRPRAEAGAERPTREWCGCTTRRAAPTPPSIPTRSPVQCSTTASEPRSWTSRRSPTRPSSTNR